MEDINIGAFSEALNDKMDLDSGNANPSVAKQSDLLTLQNTVAQMQETITLLQGEIEKMFIKLDYANITSDITLHPNILSTSSYTAPSDGFIIISSIANSSASIWRINEKVIHVNDFSNKGTPFIGDLIPVSAGDVFSVYVDSSLGSARPTIIFQFCPLKV